MIVSSPIKENLPQRVRSRDVGPSIQPPAKFHWHIIRLAFFNASKREPGIIYPFERNGFQLLQIDELEGNGRGLAHSLSLRGIQNSALNQFSLPFGSVRVRVWRKAALLRGRRGVRNSL